MAVPDLPINLFDGNLWWAIFFIFFNPCYWNLVARWQYRTQTLSRFFRSRRVACVLLACTIFALGLCRDYWYYLALGTQPRCLLLHDNYILWTGHVLVVLGSLLVVSSFWALGFYGTFLGDYFGILQVKRVTSFPFNLFDNPMYFGSFLNFLGAAFTQGSLSGVLLSFLVAVVYKLAISYEGPFTANIYMMSSASSKKST